MMVMVDYKRTKWMKPPLADHVWTDEEVEEYYIWRERADEEMRTVGKTVRAQNCGMVSTPDLVPDN